MNTCLLTGSVKAPSPSIFGNSANVGPSDASSFGSTLFSFTSGSTSTIDRLNISGFGALDNLGDISQNSDMDHNTPIGSKYLVENRFNVKYVVITWLYAWV
jgi:hypothetical protein